MVQFAGVNRKLSARDFARTFRAASHPSCSMSLSPSTSWCTWAAGRNPRVCGRVPTDTRRWEPSSDLAERAKEISKYIANSGYAEATIVASDEV